MQLDPLDNALDFLASAAENLAATTNDDRNLKYGTLHLVAAVEILLKVRLAREHWSLVFDGFGRKGKRSEAQAYASGDFVSVSWVEAVRRLRDIVGLELPDEIPGFERLVRRRNQLTHYGINVTPQEVRSNAARVFSFCLSFIDAQFRDSSGNLPDAVAAVVEDIRPALTKIDQLVQERLKSLEPELRAAGLAVRCPSCNQPALTFVDELAKCGFCLAAFEPEDAALSYVEDVLGISEYVTVKDGGEFPLHDCPQCGRRTLVEDAEVFYVDADDDPHSAWHPYWVCFYEGEAFSYTAFDRCDRCGTLTNTGGDDGTPICESCIGYLMAD